MTEQLAGMRNGAMAESPPGASSRRRDIQGLRALAVLMVVVFHSGLPLPGGFVGVDVFFVISGFVITTMIQREWAKNGRLDLGRFYLRRFKRLTPALALMVMFTLCMTAVLLPPLGAQQIAAKTGIGAMLLSANWVIAGNTGGYFDASAEENPLLNTWSLSVEEQFYLGFPALVLFGWVVARRGGYLRHAPTALVLTVAVASLGLACYGSSLSSAADDSWLVGFYSPFTRAWEFAAGALLALMGSRGRGLPSRCATPLAFAGLAAIAASGWFISDETPFPGAWTLVPVIGTLALLHSGQTGENVVSRTLASGPAVRLGDLSYSLYLWHWPLIVFATVVWPGSRLVPVAAALVSVAPSVASYRWVEQPIRGLPGLGRRRTVGLAAVVVLPPIALAIAVSTVATQYWTPRFESGDQPVAYAGDIGHSEWNAHLLETYYPCDPPEILKQALVTEGYRRCYQSQAGPPIDVVLIGDSHAEHLFVGLAEQLSDQNVAYYILGGVPLKSNPAFADIFSTVEKSTSIRTVVVSALWSMYEFSGPDLASSLAALSTSERSVYLTDDLPTFTFDPFRCKYRQGILLPTECSMPADGFWAAHREYGEKLEQAVDSTPGTNLVRTAKLFCDPDSCDMVHAGRMLFRDTNHLNLDGSRYVAEELASEYPELRHVRPQSE